MPRSPPPGVPAQVTPPGVHAQVTPSRCPCLDHRPQVSLPRSHPPAVPAQVTTSRCPCLDHRPQVSVPRSHPQVSLPRSHPPGVHALGTPDCLMCFVCRSLFPGLLLLYLKSLLPGVYFLEHRGELAAGSAPRSGGLPSPLPCQCDALSPRGGSLSGAFRTAAFRGRPSALGC